MILRSAADGRRHERPRLRARSPRLRPLLPPAGSLGGSSPVGPTEPPTPLRTARSERPGSYLGQASSRHRTAPARPSTALSSESGTELRRSPPATGWHPPAASGRHRRAARRRCADTARAGAGGAIRRWRRPASLRPKMDGRCRRPGRRDWTSRNSAEQRCRSRLAKPSQHFSVTHDPCCSTRRRYRPRSTPNHRQHRRGSTRVSRFRQAARSYCTPAARHAPTCTSPDPPRRPGRGGACDAHNPRGRTSVRADPTYSHAESGGPARKHCTSTGGHITQLVINQ